MSKIPFKVSGSVGVSVVAGYIEVTSTARTAVGQQVEMAGSSVYFYIRPDVAKQWLPIIEKLAAESE
jgi:hypothetical protein